MLISKWDKIYTGATNPGQAASVLLNNQHLLPEAGTALDIACGLGANALLLSKNDFATTAWDSSTIALKQLDNFSRQGNLSIKLEQIDVEKRLIVKEKFDVITVSHFLYRPLCPFIVDSLKPDGLLFYQTFTKQKSIEAGPKNPSFLLEKNELLKLFSSLSPVFYQEERDCGDTNQGLRNLACLIARKD